MAMPEEGGTTMRAPWMAALILGTSCASAPPGGATDAYAAQEAAAASPHATLEAIFWQCDYVATTVGVHATQAAACAAATRELRQAKFDGSFHRMLEWWRQNKPAEHGRIRRERNDPPL
jgi:hypothetical protein